MLNFGVFDKSGDLNQLQNRISEVFALILTLLVPLLCVLDFLMGYKLIYISIKFLFVFPFLIGYLVMKKYGHHQLILILMFTIGLAAISLNFFLSEAHRSRTLYTLFIFVVSSILMLRGRFSWVWITLIFVVYGVLIGLGRLEKYKVAFDIYSSDDFFQDQILTVTWTSLFTLVIILLFIKSYQKQNLYMLELQKDKELALNKLENLNDKKNQLLALLSHDLKTPVTSLNFTLELAEEGMINEKEMAQIISNLRTQSFHLSKVLDNTLEWVITEMEGSDADLATINPVVITEEMVEVMRFQANQKSQSVEFEAMGDSLEIILPFKEIRIILKNFLDNAIKFTPKGSIILVQLFQNFSKIRWEVKNEGKSVDEADRPFLFELKAKKSEGTLQEKGTGIGLSLCKKIASRQGWEIGYLYSDNKWNVFFLEIDLTKS
ncbi:sensor histidine kinase [Algoriphagus sanaruensis]|uniref:histidine kinase n=1 Tax=Algoriphagus sanaruensis TaxID=1727163 RepID=A0A142ERN7_9BACT|nr:HAMP domain-containing sensor histidine kinase [Algoriphagus sanaruensis]AMQ57792.1 hypothetical protein AO498_15160 [Algoriphagus sanaruensis]